MNRRYVEASDGREKRWRRQDEYNVGAQGETEVFNPSCPIKDAE